MSSAQARTHSYYDSHGDYGAAGSPDRQASAGNTEPTASIILSQRGIGRVVIQMVVAGKAATQARGGVANVQDRAGVHEKGAAGREPDEHAEPQARARLAQVPDVC